MPLIERIPASARRLVTQTALACLVALSIVTLVLPGFPGITQSQNVQIDAADTAWMLTAAALVMLMTPGVALFYGGLVRHKNVLSTMLLTIVNMGAMSVLWIFVGFSLAFGDSWSKSGVVGNPSQHAFFKDVTLAPNAKFNGSVPMILFATFQMMFAVITPSIVNGCFVERGKFSGCLLFFTLWHVLVYCPVVHMVMHPQGLLRTWGLEDFAGGTVVHVCAGFSALAGSIVMGPREERVSAPARLTDVLLGTSLMWFGWFGFNGGSAGRANLAAVLAFLNSNTAAAVSMVAWLLLDRSKGRPFRATGACCGAVAGLVSITSCAAYVSVGGACCIGIISALTCNTAIEVVRRFQFIDEPMDVFALHGVGGLVGVICTSLFSRTSINPSTINGLLYGNLETFWRTLLAMAGIIPYITITSWLCCLAADYVMGIRVEPEAETTGLDVAIHAEAAVASDLRYNNPSAALSSFAISALIKKQNMLSRMQTMTTELSSGRATASVIVATDAAECSQ